MDGFRADAQTSRAFDGDPMASDAKLGLVLGVAIVLVIGLVFFRAESPSTAQGTLKNANVTTALVIEEPRSQ